MKTEVVIEVVIETEIGAESSRVECGRVGWKCVLGVGVGIGGGGGWGVGWIGCWGGGGGGSLRLIEIEKLGLILRLRLRFVSGSYIEIERDWA